MEPDATAASDVPSELPYPMAKRLRDQGMSDALIVAELQRKGLTAADAHFVITSLPGGTLSSQRGPALSTQGNLSGGGGVPVTGFVMLGLGLLVTLGSFMTAAPGGTYIVTWGLILAGVLRIMRGR